MPPTYLLVEYSLKSILRTRFFWIWNAIIFLLVISLNYITFFDFEGGSLISELFLTTSILSGAVNSLVFHLGTVKDLSRRHWDLLVIRPVRPRSIVIGSFIALVVFQVAIGLLFLAGFLLESRLLRHATPDSLWMGWTIAMLEIAMLGALYGLIAIWLNEFWAIVTMTGVFLVGHLSTQFGPSFFASIIFCMVPDLDLPVPLGKSDIPVMLPSELTRGGLYAISYIILILYVSCVSIRATLGRR